MFQPMGRMLAPVGRERRVLQQQLQLFLVAGLVEQDVGGALHRQLRVGSVHQCQLPLRIHPSLFQHPQQPATAAIQLHHLGELAIAKALVELETGGSGLAYLDQRLPKSIDIADAGLRLRQPRTREILAKGGRLPGCAWYR